ncbi:Sec-independent protein translocase protein TatB [Sphingomonas sp. AOB5]|uniref:Sec-independent protein translocase protein TatB n=1 Tax=Sphingomonas sp. AOB5 TaxID=3034017 RepID=UPI0023F97BFF|nr:Sec-independent protein translocase protein TatB [Sphingomonas sp. AOB5]MDF7775753.1 Sec-independent protein translocase protein TatB [Sphingomonas sp. AOB5]
MLDVAPTELLLVAVVALLVIGPKDLPKAMRVVGKWIGRARGVARQFRSGIDTMIRESELADLQKQWAEENERIMRDHPPTQSLPAPQTYLSPEQQALAADPLDRGALMTEQPVIKDSWEAEPAPEPEVKPKAKPRARKPKTSDLIEAPESAPKAGATIEAPKPKTRKPRAKAAS